MKGLVIDASVCRSLSFHILPFFVSRHSTATGTSVFVSTRQYSIPLEHLRAHRELSSDNIMSSSEDEAVRRPGRSTDASRVHSADVSDHAESLVGSDADQLNGHHDDDDADLFGSGSDGDLDE